MRLQCADSNADPILLDDGTVLGTAWSVENIPRVGVAQATIVVDQFLDWFYGSYYPDCSWLPEIFTITLQANNHRTLNIQQARDLSTVRLEALRRLGMLTRRGPYEYYSGACADRRDHRYRIAMDLLYRIQREQPAWAADLWRELQLHGRIEIPHWGYLERSDFECDAVRSLFQQLYHPPAYDTGTSLLLAPDDMDTPDSPRTFGLEFEFIASRSQDYFAECVDSTLQGIDGAAPFENGGYRHSSGRMWDLKTDSSCGLELCTPALTWARWSDVELVLDALRDAGAEVDGRCGLHVHHSCPDLKPTGIRRLMLLWMAYEKVLFAMVRGERASNQYCRSFQEYYESWSTMKESLVPLRNLETEMHNTGKYRSLNVSGWWQHGRVEVRIHHGTLNASVAKFWTLLTQRMIEVAHTTRDYREMEEVFRQDLCEQVGAFQKLLNNPKLASVVEKVLLVHTPDYKVLTHA